MFNDDSFHATDKTNHWRGNPHSRLWSTEENGERLLCLFHNPIVPSQRTTTVESCRKVSLSLVLVPKKWMMYSSMRILLGRLQNNTSFQSLSLDKFGVDFYHKALIAAKASSHHVKRRGRNRIEQLWIRIGLIDRGFQR